MDVTQPNQPQTQQPPQPGKSGKNNSIIWILLSVITVAILVTGVAYFFVSQSRTNPLTTNTTTSPSPAPSIDPEKVQWKKYSDTKNNYSFYYPETWSLTDSQTDMFELRNSVDQRVIQGKILSKQEADALELCKTPEPEKIACKTYPVTDTIKAPVETTMQDNIPTETEVLIPRPNQVSLYLKAPQSSYESYETLHIILYTLQFAGEKRGFPLQFCPESYSADKKTIAYKGATFSAADLDQEYIKDCK